MNGLPYYKAYPRDFIEGTIGMDFELKGAYRLILDLIYMQGGSLVDDARYISGLIGCSVKKWNGLRDRLIEAGKIDVRDGYLGNYRADKELKTLGKFQDKQRENRAHPNKNKELQSPPSNHTEPDTEATAKAVATSAPTAAASQQDLTPREQLLQAMGIGPDGVAGPSNFRGGAIDMAEAAKWTEAGLSVADQCTVAREVCQRQRRSNPSWMPRGFAYFSQSMAEFAARRSAPMRAAAPSSNALSEQEGKRAFLRRVANSGANS